MADEKGLLKVIADYFKGSSDDDTVGEGSNHPDPAAISDPEEGQGEKTETPPVNQSITKEDVASMIAEAMKVPSPKPAIASNATPPAQSRTTDPHAWVDKETISSMSDRIAKGDIKPVDDAINAMWNESPSRVRNIPFN